jgi:hypothetical protein
MDRRDVNTREDPRQTVETEPWPPCPEAQADGVPCPELGQDCEDCERADPEYTGEKTPSVPLSDP